MTTPTGWCVDGWYSSRELAEGMREFYVSAGASESHIVEHHEWHSFGVVYAMAGPFVDWHARP